MNFHQFKYLNHLNPYLIMKKKNFIFCKLNQIMLFFENNKERDLHIYGF